MLTLVAIGWMFVVLLMAAAEAAAPNGSLLGAAITFVFGGVFPLALLLYLGGASARRRTARIEATSAPEPDGSGHAPGDAVATKREET